MISASEQERRYAELMGADALARQKREARVKCSYCGGRNGQHMNLCPHRPKHSGVGKRES